MLPIRQERFYQKDPCGFGGRHVRLFGQLSQFLESLGSLIFVKQGGSKPQTGLVCLGARQGGEIDSLPFGQSLLPAPGFIQGQGPDQEDPVGQVPRCGFRQGCESLRGSPVRQQGFGQQNLGFRLRNRAIFLEPTTQAGHGIPGQAVTDHFLGHAKIFREFSSMKR